MPLSPQQLAQREGKITASFLPALMAGKNEEIYDEWLRLIGDPKWKPKDLSDNWPVQFGAFNEPFALDWHERKTGQPLIRRGEVVQHPTRPYVAATLDCYRAHDDCVIDCKCSGAWMTLDHIEGYYQPQLIVQRSCTSARNAALLVVHGSAEPVELAARIDPNYESLLWTRVEQFQYCVENLIPPVQLPPAPPPPPWRTIDLVSDSDLPNWAPDMIRHLTMWNETRDASKTNETAKEEIKTLLPDDVGRVRFGDLLIVRARNRAVTIKRERS
jgi:hypothetical protein